MPESINNPSRRVFLGSALKLGATSLVLGSALPVPAADQPASHAGQPTQ